MFKEGWNVVWSWKKIARNWSFPPPLLFSKKKER